MNFFHIGHFSIQIFSRYQDFWAPTLKTIGYFLSLYINAKLMTLKFEDRLINSFGSWNTYWESQSKGNANLFFLKMKYIIQWVSIREWKEFWSKKYFLLIQHIIKIWIMCRKITTIIVEQLKNFETQIPL